MTRDDVAETLARYKAALDAGIAMLREVEALAIAQRSHATERHYEGLTAASDTRGTLTRALTAMEPGLREVRAALANVDVQLLVDRPDYDEVKALKALARDLVARIVAIDEISLQSLADAELARRAALANLETGEHTLAAYRRVLTPAAAAPSLLDFRT